jgi:hypothetical protein
VSLVVMLPLILNAALSNVRAAAQDAPQTGSVTGQVRMTDSQPLTTGTVRMRQLESGDVVASTNSGRSGEFSFSGLTPGNYVIDVIDANGKVVGMSAPLALSPGAAPSVSIVAVAGGVLAGSGGGVSLFGLGPVTSIAVLGAAGAAAVTAVVSTRPDASPSQ